MVGELDLSGTVTYHTPQKRKESVVVGKDTGFLDKVKS